ncbi:MAG: penicillin-binding protein 2 [Trueperaceae bacterium]|nr:penicillin-binding protein 2 [Trueperaceae bacterium]
MALSHPTPTRSNPAVPGELRMHRGVLVGLAAVIPLLAALWGFAAQQSGAPSWPAGLVEATVRGTILTADGAVLAEGPVDARRYPQAALAGSLVGFTGSLQASGAYGLEGLEHSFDARLQRGEDVVLTLDATVQAAAEAHLAATVAATGARAASAVVLEVGTGRVLAAASVPTYDPNAYAAADPDAMQNRALLQQYEPGSVMKPFVVAALLESGRLTSDESIPTPPTLRVGLQTFRDVAAHEDELSVADVLRYSSNTGAIALAQRFESVELHAWVAAFGFGQPLAMPSAYTRSGSLPDPERWVPQDHASIAIGQGVSTTNLQLAAAYAVIAQDGLYVPPRLVEGDVVPDPHRVVSPESAMAVRTMLTHTIDAGSLRSARLPGIATAGKTGTADVYDAALGGYAPGKYALTFAGMFPADRPEIVMVVTVHEPETSTSSTVVAAPLFRAIGAEVVAHWAVAPDGPAWARAAVR